MIEMAASRPELTSRITACCDLESACRTSSGAGIGGPTCIGPRLAREEGDLSRRRRAAGGAEE